MGKREGCQGKIYTWDLYVDNATVSYELPGF